MSIKNIRKIKITRIHSIKLNKEIYMYETKINYKQFNLQHIV